MKFKDIAMTVYNKYWLDGRSSRTNLGTVKELINKLGCKHIEKITSDCIDVLVESFENDKLKPATINRKLMVLSKIFTYAYEEKIISSKPRIKQLRVDNNKIIYFTPEDEQQVYKYFETSNRPMYYFSIIAFQTGMRLSEILALSPENIQDGYIRCWLNKADLPRSIPMSNAVKSAINAIEPDMFKYSLDANKVQYSWRKFLKDNPTINQEYTIHSMRHTFCTRLVQAGKALNIIQKLAGHKNEAMTKRYAHLSDDNLEQAIDIFN